MEQEKVSLEWPEYVVFAFTLSISAIIGIYYGFFGTKQKSTTEYLLANREMSAWPVSMSLVCSAVSAITILGNPVETYLYGTPTMWIIFTYIPFTLSLAFLYLPVYFRLKVNSAYEYIELRFNSTVRTTVSLIAIVQLIVSMAIAVYAPSLAINQVTGISTRISTAVIYLVCVFYSTLGGLKAVLWTDVFQAFVMLASVLVTLIIGLGDVGGLSEAWKLAGDAGRLEFFKSPD
ncbi:unnamed protein product [Allacma fusca]|uniref:Sodium-dependent multivitamin transporter n=1 Tax=Allacma fusca TaxID=39272 RepID=A0A8J2JVE6_9HEXA|nr:unnamed protein product [Allacma fusca]